MDSRIPEAADPDAPLVTGAGGTITGLILAGGRGTRMGSVDKGLQPFRDMPMALHVLYRLQEQVAEIMINANQNLAAYEAFGVQVWPDATTGFVGPLAGLQTGLMHCDTPYLVTAPCDSPFLPADLVVRLAAAMHAEHADVAIAVTGSAGHLQPHPVFCLAKATLLPHLSAFLQDGGRKVDAWFATLKTARVHFDDEQAFRNINTLDELQRFDAAGA
jgi:molybdopterin-guanine dinucleotide biosynthesis protein A